MKLITQREITRQELASYKKQRARPLRADEGWNRP